VLHFVSETQMEMPLTFRLRYSNTLLFGKGNVVTVHR
jgi:hypothetical protein